MTTARLQRWVESGALRPHRTSRREIADLLAEVVELPGVMAYGAGHDEAVAKAQALALRVVADLLEHDEAHGDFLSISFNAA